MKTENTALGRCTEGLGISGAEARGTTTAGVLPKIQRGTTVSSISTSQCALKMSENRYVDRD